MSDQSEDMMFDLLEVTETDGVIVGPISQQNEHRPIKVLCAVAQNVML
jgi:hypothetical protein